jgi:hypothetical protein
LGHIDVSGLRIIKHINMLDGLLFTTILLQPIKASWNPRNFLKGLLRKPFKKFLGFDNIAKRCICKDE